MDDDRWRLVKDLFAEALEMDAALRDAFLLERCPHDATVRDEVRSLLASHDADSQFMATPATEAIETHAGGWPAPLEGRRVGPYLLGREIGRGGMGTVYLASRADGAFERQVAIKVVRRGLDSADVAARFRHERHTLASLDHPNIARLLDGGTSEDGLPYFVMEYVDGVPIDRYCDERRLGVSRRLELFREVCAAVQVAHQRLVIHRDLKPDNILVTSSGHPKLVDFGIAKVLDPSEPTPFHTRATERVLTPGYASPEQVRGEPLTTASDVYSLGVLLCELLTGRHPREHGGAAPLALRVEPGGMAAEKSSAMVLRPVEPAAGAEGGEVATAETLAAARGESPSSLSRKLAGDLDTIVAVAMHGDPQRRYGAVDRLSEDLRRHLEGLPIAARRDALGYRVARFVTRHAAAVAAAGLVAVLTVAGVAAIAWEARAVAIQRDRARIQAEKASRISAFLQDMLRAPDPGNQGRSVTLVDVLGRAAKRLETEPASHPEILTPVHRALGVTYGSLGMFDAAERHLRAALAAAPQTPESAADRAGTESDLAGVLSAVGATAAAEALYRQALSRFEALGLLDSLGRADALTGLGELFRRRGDDTGAEVVYREALDIRRRLLGDRDLAVAEALNNLAVVMHGRGRLPEAERLYRESLQILRASRGDDHPGVPVTLSNIAAIAASRGNLAEAERLAREALAIHRRVLGEDHPDLAVSIYSLADTLELMGRYAEAAALCREVLARRGRSLPDGHPVVGASLLILGKSLTEAGDVRGGEAAIRESLAIRRAALPAGHWQIASVESALGRCLCKQGRFQEAEGLLVGSFERLRADRGPAHERTTDALRNLVACYQAWNQPAKAAAYQALMPR